MEIVHFAPYAPGGAGIYEAARDMVRADAQRGHLVSFVDVGATSIAGVQAAPQVGAVDDRGGYRLVTMPIEWANTADILVYHTGVNDGWVVKNQAPIIMVVHGRPLAAFRPEQNGSAINSYSLYADMAKWPRIKKLVYFWPEFNPYWRVIFPANKRVCLDYPPIDLERFTPDGPRHEWAPEHRGKWNALICDSWRDDVDCFEIANGAIEAARRIKGLKIHIYAIETQKGTSIVPRCWEFLIGELRHLGALGELSGRQLGMDAVYRAADFVLTPHRIVTRITGEALACGVPVLAGQGCTVTPWTARVDEPEHVGEVAVNLVKALEADREGVREDSRATAKRFDLKTYGWAMEAVYRIVTKAGPKA
jgi:glycosyltransferase involved in cell wall biosynthesis